MNFFDQLKQELDGKHVKIVFPEGHDIRVLAACVDLHRDGYVEPIVLGDTVVVEALAAKNNLDLTGMTLIDPRKYADLETLVQKFVERRNGKVSETQARELLLKDGNYFGTMLVFTGIAQGMVSGADNSTAATIRPALQIVKMKPGAKKVSGVVFLVKENERLYYADCGVNIMPDSYDLAETARITAQTVRQFKDEPRVALLSFSSKGSASSPEQEKVAQAFEIAKEQESTLLIDGEIQFDTAYVPEVAESKAPNSPLKGRANTFIFPTLDAGNICYKVTQRLGGYEAIGPILQGIAKPINDLSRGCNQQDVYNLGLVTAIQALDNQ